MDLWPDRLLRWAKATPPRTVGFAMHGADDQDSLASRAQFTGPLLDRRHCPSSDKRQRMLERERIKFDDSGRCDLENVLWRPRGSSVQGQGDRQSAHCALPSLTLSGGTRIQRKKS